MSDPDPYAGRLHRLINLILLIIPIVVLLIVCLSAHGESSLLGVKPIGRNVVSQRNTVIVDSGGTMLFSSPSRSASLHSFYSGTRFTANPDGASSSVAAGRMTLRSSESVQTTLGLKAGLSLSNDLAASTVVVGLSNQALRFNGWDLSAAAPLEPTTWLAALVVTFIVAVNPVRKLVNVARPAADRAIRRWVRRIPAIVNPSVR